MVVFSALTYTGVADQLEILAADFAITAANTLITAENARRAALVPPGTPLALWPNSTNAEKKASYLGILLQGVTNTHASYVQQASSPQEFENWFTQPERQQIRANFITRRKAGETGASLVTDSAA